MQCKNKSPLTVCKCVDKAMSPHHLCACLFSRPCLSSSLLCWEKELRQSQGEGVGEPPSKHFSEDYVFRLPPYIPPFTLHVYACLSNDSAWGQCLKPAPFSSLYVIHFDVGLQRQERLRGEGKMFKEKAAPRVCCKRRIYNVSGGHTLLYLGFLQFISTHVIIL